MAKRKKGTVPQKWRKLFKLIPDYDPIATAAEGEWFDAAEADKAVGFFEDCIHHTKGEWRGETVVLADWQKAFIGCLFGWKNAEGYRRYSTCFVFIPRKNGKSTIGAGIACKMLFADKEGGAEVYSAAGDRQQAKIVFGVASEMIQFESEMLSRAEVYTKSVVVLETGSAYHALSSDASTKHGFNAHGIIFDELHVQKNRDFYDTLATSTGTRRQPILFIITTAGFDTESICYEVYDYACKVRDGILEDSTFLPVVYEAKKSADKRKDDRWDDPKTWKKANPNLGVSVKISYLEKELKRAKNSPAYENTFRRLHLNQWTEQAERWISIDKWDACVPPEPIEITDLYGRPCFGGLDLSSTKDTTSLILAFPMDPGVVLLPFIWLPTERIKVYEGRVGDKVPYEVWEKQGYIRTTPGHTVDYDRIRTTITGYIGGTTTVVKEKVNSQGTPLSELFDIKEIAIDRWQAHQMTVQLDDDGMTMVPFGQGYASMSAPSKEFDRLIDDGQLWHRAHPVLRWMASNIAIATDAAENIKPDRKKSKGRIDGIVAAIMAIGRNSVNPDVGSVYDQRGITTIG